MAKRWTRLCTDGEQLFSRMATKLTSILSPILPSPGHVSPGMSKKFGGTRPEGSEGGAEGAGQNGRGEGTENSSDVEERPEEGMSTLAKFTKGIQVCILINVPFYGLENLYSNSVGMICVAFGNFSNFFCQSPID